MNTFSRKRISAGKLLPILLGLSLGTAAQATVYWEDYPGTNFKGNTTEDLYVSGTNYRNNPTASGLSSAQIIDDLLALSTLRSPVRSGTDGNIAWSEVLCNGNTDPTLTATQACQLKAEGRITYTIIRFPQAGTYTLTNTNIDDFVRLDTFPIIDATSHASDYRTLSYTVGTVGGSNTVAATYAAPLAGSCLLVRHLWNNIHTFNSAQLSWSGPGVTAGVIPAADLSDPQTFDFSACVPQVAITKTASANNVSLGGNVTYTITASAAAAGADADGTVVTDTLPAGLDAATATWTCTTSGGAACPNNSGTGNINETITTFPAGSSVTYTLTATVTSNAPNSIQNSASLTTPPGITSLCQPGNTPSPCPSATVTMGVLKPVPALNMAGLLGLAALLMLVHGIARRRSA